MLNICVRLNAAVLLIWCVRKPTSRFPRVIYLLLPGGMMRMSGSVAASQVHQQPPRPSAVPVLDAQAAELKAERLWGMADARKPVSIERQNGMPEVSQF